MCTPPQPFIPALDTAKLEMRYLLFGQNVLNVHYFRREGGWSQTSLTDLVVQAESAWNTYLRPLQATGLELVEIYARNVETQAAEEATNPVGLTGQVVQGLVPNNVSLAVSFRTGLTGRSNRGRMYWLGLTEEQVANSEVISTHVDNIHNGVEAFFAEFNELPTEAQHVVVSYCANSQWRQTASVRPVLDYLIVDPTVDSQRRRLPHRGR